MITKLTRQEREMIDEVREEWLGIFNRLEFDENKAKEMINFLYRLDKRKPPLILIADSPLAVQLMANAVTSSP